VGRIIYGPITKHRFISDPRQLLLGEKMPDETSVAQLMPGMRRVDFTGTVTAISATRDVQTKYGPAQVAEAILTDGNGGKVKVTLWNENISKVEVGNALTIENGYTDSFRGELQLHVGRYGKISVGA